MNEYLPYNYYSSFTLVKMRPALYVTRQYAVPTSTQALELEG